MLKKIQLKLKIIKIEVYTATVMLKIKAKFDIEKVMFVAYIKRPWVGLNHQPFG